MAKEEQILNKAIDYSEIEENFLEYDDCGDVCDDKAFVQKAYMEGAKVARADLMEDITQWLLEELYEAQAVPNLFYNSDVKSHHYDTVIEFIEALKKAVDEEDICNI